tara:strand:- start:947 stop:1177 length:231 start_codon:yes stop_codon:yes gene_type:complete
MILSREELSCRKIEVDLHSSEGNSFYLLGLVETLGKQINIPTEIRKDIRKTMMSGSYDDLIETFDIWFGDYVVIYK